MGSVTASATALFANYQTHVEVLMNHGDDIMIDSIHSTDCNAGFSNLGRVFGRVVTVGW